MTGSEVDKTLSTSRPAALQKENVSLHLNCMKVSAPLTTRVKL